MGDVVAQIIALPILESSTVFRARMPPLPPSSATNAEFPNAQIGVFEFHTRVISEENKLSTGALRCWALRLLDVNRHLVSSSHREQSNQEHSATVTYTTVHNSIDIDKYFQPVAAPSM